MPLCVDTQLIEVDNLLGISWPWHGMKVSGDGSWWKSGLDRSVMRLQRWHCHQLTLLPSHSACKGPAPSTYSPTQLIQINKPPEYGERFLCFRDHCLLKDCCWWNSAWFSYAKGPVRDPACVRLRLCLVRFPPLPYWDQDVMEGPPEDSEEALLINPWTWSISKVYPDAVNL